ncbi:MAG: hypothetical protein M0011_11380 [Elusimicrobia bacterium]|nr:hypothetical protein [Elusimicrobiota bacterium]
MKGLWNDLLRRPGAALRYGAILACLAVPMTGRARADSAIDPARQIMGRVTYPAKAWTIDSWLDYHLNKFKDENRDTLSHTLELGYGFTDSLSMEWGIESREGPRRSFIYDRLQLEARYQVLKRPFQLAPVLGYAPSLRGGPDRLELALEAIKNSGDYFFQFMGGADSENEGSGRELGGSVQLGVYHRFGAGSVVGGAWKYQSDGEQELSVPVSVVLGKDVFFGFTPSFGLSRRAPELSALFLVDIYFGPYALLDWMLE